MNTTNRIKLAILMVAIGGLSSAGTAIYYESGNRKAVYVIGAVSITDAERLPEYRAMSEPMAHRLAGYEPLAYAQPEVLDGKLPIDARYFVERYDSREQLKEFMTELKSTGGLQLRNEIADMHFLLALPAYGE